MESGSSNLQLKCQSRTLNVLPTQSYQNCQASVKHRRDLLHPGTTLWSMPYGAARRFFFQTAHMEAATPSDDVTSAVTTVDRLENARPKVVISEKDVRDYINKEDGMVRLKETFRMNKNGQISDELSIILDVTKNCAAVVFLVTSVLGGNAARQKFVDKNKHKAYETKYQAMRAYNDAVVFGSFRLGIKWCLKSAFFTALFMTTSQAISVYRNKTGVVEYVVAGGITCGLLRMSVGLRGMFAGSVIGGALGLATGACVCALMNATNCTQQQRRYSAVEQMLREKREIELLQSNSVQSLSTGTLESQPV